jgi:hypothetical protein
VQRSQLASTLVALAVAALAYLSVCAGASSAAVASGNCSTVSAAVVQHAIGGSATAPTSTSSSPGSSPKYLTCSYGKHDSVTYYYNVNASFLNDAIKNLKAKRLSGVGSAAITFVISGNPAQTVVQAVFGTTVVDLVSPATVTREETLVKEIGKKL